MMISDRYELIEYQSFLLTSSLNHPLLNGIFLKYDEMSSSSLFVIADWMVLKSAILTGMPAALSSNITRSKSLSDRTEFHSL